MPDEKYRTRPTNPEGTSTETYFGTTNAKAYPQADHFNEQAPKDYRIECSDDNAMCPWEARGATEDEVLDAAAQHAHEKHGASADAREQFRSRIKKAA